MKIILFDLFIGGHHIKYTSYLVRYFIRRGDEVIFVGWGEDDRLSRLKELGARVELVNKRPINGGLDGGALKRSWGLYKGLDHCFRVASSFNVDLVHYLYLDRSELPLFLKIKSQRCCQWRTFATLHWPHFVDKKIHPIKKLYHKVNQYSLNRLFHCRYLDNVFVHTQAIKKKLLTNLYDVSENRVTVVPDPIELPSSDISMSKARKDLDLPSKQPILLFFGKLRWNKGPDILLKAYDLIESGNFYLVIAGQPGEKGSQLVSKWKKKFSRPDRIITKLRYIPERRVHKYFQAADAVLLPYRHSFKGTSGIMHNATAAGKPVIATDVGQIGPTVRRHKLGILTQESPESFAQGIKEFLSSMEKLSKEIKPRALEYANSHEWNNMAKKVREKYIEVKD